MMAWPKIKYYHWEDGETEVGGAKSLSYIGRSQKITFAIENYRL